MLFSHTPLRHLCMKEYSYAMYEDTDGEEEQTTKETQNLFEKALTDDFFQDNLHRLYAQIFKAYTQTSYYYLLRHYYVVEENISPPPECFTI